MKRLEKTLKELDKTIDSLESRAWALHDALDEKDANHAGDQVIIKKFITEYTETANRLRRFKRNLLKGES